MDIEVTNQTFYKIINSNDFVSTENLKSAKKHYYYNYGNNQKGIIVYNFKNTKTIIMYY